MKTKLLLITGLLFFVTLASAGSDFIATTQIQNSQCGQTLPTINTNIMADAVSGATSYRFKIVPESNNFVASEQIITRPTRVFNLTQVANYAFGKRYHIKVSVLFQGIWQPYGADCVVTSPTPMTKIQNSQCSINIATMTDVIYANAVSLAAGYRFRVTNAADPYEVHILDRSLREFRMSLAPDVLYGTTYLVEVAVKNTDGTFLPYGEVCTVTTPIPSTKIQSSQCGATLGYMADVIYADLVPNCTGYRFRIINANNPYDVQTIDRALREFRMNQLNGIQFNTYYRVQVAIRYGSGNYLPYGPVCVIKTPGIPTPKIRLSQCEFIASNNSELIYADPIPNATVYRFKLQNNELEYNDYVDNSAGFFRLSMFNNLASGTTYTVKVAVKVNGVFTSFGKGCSITTAGMNSKESTTEDQKDSVSFAAVLSPNPFSETFSIDLKTTSAESVFLGIYDLTGRLLETKTVDLSLLATLKIGDQYRAGVYSVTIRQGKNEKTYRMIKR